MFHTRLKALREQKHLSQEQLAELLGVKQQTIGKWENRLTVPRLPMLQKIATIFNVTIDYVMGESDDPHGSPFTGHVDGQFLTFAPEQIKPEETALLEAYRKAPDHIRQIVDTSLKPYLKTGADIPGIEILPSKERDKLDVDQETARVSRNPEAETTTLDVTFTPAEVAKMLGKRQPKRIAWKKTDDKEKTIYVYFEVGGKNNKKKALYRTMLPIKDTPPNFVEKLLSTGKIVEDDD